MPQAGGERGGDVVHVALRILDAEDQHVLGHPAFLVALVAGDAQCEAFFAQQHVSAVAGVDGPDGVVLGELDDVAVLRVDVRTGMLAAARNRWNRPADAGPSHPRGS